MILLENLKTISPQEAKDQGLFGPVWHGTTHDKLEKISTQGFKTIIGTERSGDVSHGYEMSNYWGGIPAPIHHLGFGIYFTTVKAIAKQFSYGNPNIGPYFLDVPNLLTINFGSPRTMMKWWLENGYDYRKTPETLFGNEKTDLWLMRQERMRATINMTDYLKSRYDGVWFKGKGIYRLLDGDQVVVYDPSKIYKMDKSLIKPGEIGSKVIAKVGINPYGGKEIIIPIGTKGIILDKKRLEDEYRQYHGNTEWVYTIKWEKGGTMYMVRQEWIEPYEKKKKLSEEKIYKIGDCRNESLVNDIFGNVSEFARQIEEKGNNFIFGNIAVVYDQKNDIHTFWKKEKQLTETQIYRRSFWKDYENVIKESDYDHSKALKQTGYWGKQGAGAIILAKSTGRILLPFRSRYVEQPHTWGVWGGAIDKNEDPATAVKREIHEETGYAGPIQLVPMYVFENPRVGFKYSNFLAIVPNEFQPHHQWETEKSKWIEFGNWPTPLHFGLKTFIQHSGNEILQNIKKIRKI